ncbi:hypothetical protein F0562_004300 [Nyssa sinensis]|uniref:Uncharacterized protein n=1 Tax=Nyssa sinensis TaxID=561372 RepID=A0A5J5C2W1_9ASTE|nr:hypothetical protein F0562_004300 [Nyssa sinensis]
MDSDTSSQLRDKENEDNPDEDDSTSSALFFRHSTGNLEDRNGEISNKEEAQMLENMAMNHLSARQKGVL